MDTKKKEVVMDGFVEWFYANHNTHLERMVEDYLNSSMLIRGEVEMDEAYDFFTTKCEMRLLKHL